MLITSHVRGRLRLSNRYYFSGLREATFTRVHIISHVELIGMFYPCDTTILLRTLLLWQRMGMVSTFVVTHGNGFN